MKKTFAIHTLGCKVNTYESDAMAEALRANGYEEGDFDSAADIYIINTCTVTNIADRKSRQMLRRARKVNPDALIVAAGCYVDDAARNDKLGELISEGVIDVAVSNKDKQNIVRMINAHFEENEGAAALAEEPTKPLFMTELDGHTRAFIKVQDGCNMFCTYCIIPYVRGRIEKRPVDEVITEVRALAASGVSEVVLTGIHLTSLGDSLLEMAEGIAEIEGIERIRFGSLEPTLITREFLNRLVKIRKFCPHFHLSLQSGSDTTLKRMNRHYTADEYAACCDLIREYYVHPAITTDIIVGFPGETEVEFEETRAFAERIGFYEAHVFKYSRRKGTPADGMPNQLTENEKGIRSDRLMEVTDRLSSEFRRYYLHKENAFLCEEGVTIDGVQYETGYNTEYVRCLKKSDEVHVSGIVSGMATAILEHKTWGECLVLE